MTLRLIIKLFFIVTTLFLAMPYALLYAREGTVKVGVYDNAPVVFQDEEGDFRGLSIEVLEYIAKEESWEIEYVLGTFAECLERLERGDIDVQVFIAYSKERALKFNYNQETLLSNWGVVYVRPKSSIKTILDLEGKKVVLGKKHIHSGAFVNLIESFNIHPIIISVDEYSEGITLMGENKADAIVVNRIFGLANAKASNMEKTNIIFYPVEIRYAAPKWKNADILTTIDRHLKELKADKKSLFYQSFNKAFAITEPITTFPKWIYWGAFSALLLFGFLVFFNSILNRRVRKRTNELQIEISERKQAEDKLIKNQYYLTKAQEMGIIATWELDLQKNILKWTDENYKIFGVPLGTEMNYEIFLNCVHPDDRDYVQEKWSAGLNKEPYDIEHRLIVNDKVKWVREKADIEFDTEGNPIMAIGFTQEITERKRAEEELKKHREHLEELVEDRTNELKEKTDKNEASRKALTYLVEDVNVAREDLEKANRDLGAVNTELQDFAYIVSHDLKAPLRAVSQLAYWISQDYAEVLDEDGKEHLNLLNGRVKRMDGLINGILQYSRLGRAKEKQDKIDLAKTLPSVIETLSPPENIRITIEDELPEIVGNNTHMEQVFQNLLGNAIKFMDKPEGLITIGCRDEGPHWEFRIIDNGPGIEEKYHERIFKIFQTLVPRDEHESTGIGLTLVKKTIEQYGGKVWVESEVGKGSSFVFTLPKK